MALTGINAMPYDLSALTAQISDSVRNIKAKAAVVPQNVGSLDNGAGTYTAQPFSLNSYAVSYLEPFSLYSVQKIVSEAAEEMPEQNRRRTAKPRRKKRLKAHIISAASVLPKNWLR